MQGADRFSDSSNHLLGHQDELSFCMASTAHLVGKAAELGCGPTASGGLIEQAQPAC